ncbi:hypothetical protein [Actinokineospora inagensis]|uniref:hypothetical protein n=1 Tax=Actinokineospora inagensis TaxID=103730 RepID=UPI0012FCA471|nr:hypothetical protein [Actinokineospora inagensis]
MDFFKTLLLLLKRWYVALPVFAVTVGAAGAVYVAMPLQYESTATIVLTSPSSGPTSTTDKVNGQTNPLLAFDTSLTISASIVIQSINTPEVVKSLGADGPDNTFVLTGGGDGGPFISVKADSSTESAARDLCVKVLDKVKQELTKRQQALNAPPSTFIGVDDVVPPTKPEPLRGGKLRAAGVALALGLIASLGAVYGIDTLQQRKRRRENPEDADLDDELDDLDVPEAPTGQAQEHPSRPSLPPVSRTPQPMGVGAGELTQRVRPAQAESGNGRPVGSGAAGSTSGQLNTGSALNRPQGQGNREYREPPTVRVKPAQAPQEPRG